MHSCHLDLCFVHLRKHNASLLFPDGWIDRLASIGMFACLLDHDYDGKKIKEGKKGRRRRVHRESSQSFLSMAFACGCFSSFRILWTFSLKGAL